jgi:hypothetical protein
MILLPVMDEIQNAKVIPIKSRIDRHNKEMMKMIITTLIVRDKVLTPCSLINSIRVSIYSFIRALFSLKKLKNVSFEDIVQLLPVRY